MRNPEANVYTICLVVIIAYYILATILPIDKLIGKVYPVFGAALIIMGVGIIITMFATGKMAQVPEFAFQNLHPGRANGTLMSHVFPFVFISIACGAISGFHATQSPLMARCLKNEKEGKWVFYGAMILEGVIALIWAAVAMGYWDGVPGLAAAMGKLGGAAGIVTTSSTELMGWIGGVLAVLGVVACPITSGDTAFRSARLTIADSIKYDQKPLKNRFVIAIPLFIVGIGLVLFAIRSAANFNILWRYFAWTNQTLATIALWAVSAYLAKVGKFYWLTLCPATFMTVVVTSYFFTAGECLGPLVTKAVGGNTDMTYTIGITIGLVLAMVLFALFVPLIGIKQKNTLKA
jgi:carbon starvation protein CstA